MDFSEDHISINNGFGLELSEGSHSIRLEYSRPLKKAGAALSALGCGAFVVIALIDRRRKKSENKKDKSKLEHRTMKGSV